MFGAWLVVVLFRCSFGRTTSLLPAAPVPPNGVAPAASWGPPFAQPALGPAAAPTGDYETDLTNLIQAWYQCGFFTAKFQERYPR